MVLKWRRRHLILSRNDVTIHMQQLPNRSRPAFCLHLPLSLAVSTYAGWFSLWTRSNSPPTSTTYCPTPSAPSLNEPPPPLRYFSHAFITGHSRATNARLIYALSWNQKIIIQCGLSQKAAGKHEKHKEIERFHYDCSVLNMMGSRPQLVRDVYRFESVVPWLLV